MLPQVVAPQLGQSFMRKSKSVKLLSQVLEDFCSVVYCLLKEMSMSYSVERCLKIWIQLFPKGRCYFLFLALY